LTGLADGQLARLFPGEVHRETYQRWRTGRLTNPTPANRRRLGTLVRLFDTAAAAAVHTRDWVRNPTRVDNLSPLELLVDGRLDEVEELLSELVPGPADDEITSGEGRPVTLDTSFPRFVPRAAEPAIDLAFDANEGREEFEDDIARDDDDA
jgi:hypothetical protein